MTSDRPRHGSPGARRRRRTDTTKTKTETVRLRLQGDLYQLRIPDEIADRAPRVAWRPGKLHALRPVFRELGHPAAFVYEALEQA